MKYIIDIEKVKGTNLYRAKGANTLVFDEKGIENILKPYNEISINQLIKQAEKDRGEALKDVKSKTHGIEIERAYAAIIYWLANCEKESDEE